jgi:peptide/nickel transport system permease protein
VTSETVAIRSPLRIAVLRRFSGRRTSLWFGVGLIAAIVLLCIVVPLVWPYSTDELGAPLQSPSFSHPFGTDAVGRDVFVRTFAGGRIDLGVAVAGVGTSLVVGTLIGILAGISARWVDGTVMRLVDAFIAFPFLILALMLVVVIGPDRSVAFLPTGLPATFVAIVAVGWAWYARLARGEALSLRSRDYVVAARLLGFSTPRIVLRHLLPSVVRVTGTYAVGDAILAVIVVASLAFLGAGVQPPTPEWGSLMFEGRGYLGSAWWITVFPGVILALTGIALSLVADALLAPRRGSV